VKSTLDRVHQTTNFVHLSDAQIALIANFIHSLTLLRGRIVPNEFWAASKAPLDRKDTFQSNAEELSRRWRSCART